MIRALAVCLLSLSAVIAQQPATPPAPPTFAEALAAKLPPEWREPVATLLTIPEAQHARLLGLSDDALRQNLIRQLARVPEADAFVRTQLRSDPSARVRTAIVAAIAGDARWAAYPDTAALLEKVVASDPDVSVSISALEAIRRSRLRGLPALLAERIAAARASGDATAVARLTQEHERWISLERGTMLPAFLREAPAVFSVLPPERAIRVLAFGDYGTGSPQQKQTADAIASYHRARPLDFVITMGDNFYTAGMESTTDPRWQTWFEDLYGHLGITFYASLGNHDWGHPDSPAAEILYQSKTNSWRMPASYYTFTAGSVQFFALDTQSVAVSEKQIAWLDQELSRSTAAWKIVYGHHPIYTAGNYQDRPDLIEKLMPVMRKRVDMYLAGHDHNLQALSPDGGVHFYIAGGGGAGLYAIRQHERTVFASSALGFAVIEADAKRLAISLVDTTGKPVYEETISKLASPIGR
jgi:tartrate-resistant acid phosphatase type 5